MATKKKTLDEEKEEQGGTRTIRRPISEEEIDLRARELATLVQERDALTEKKTAKAREFTAKISVVSRKIEKLADEVATGEEEVDAQVTLEEAIQSRRGAQRGRQDRGAPVGAEP